MNFKFRHTDKLVGAFILVAILVLLLTVALVAVKQKLFTKQYLFHTQFSDAVGLNASTTLVFKGFEIGKIKAFRLNRQNTIDADISIYREYLDKVVVNSAISKSVNPITGKSALEFLQGLDSTELIPVGGFIPALDSPLGRELLLAGKIQRRGDVVFSIVNNIDAILAEIEKDYTTPEGALFRLKNSLADMTEKLDRSANQLNQLLVALQSDHNPEDGALFRSLSNVADLTGELKETNRRIDSLLVSSRQLADTYKDPENLLVKMVDPTQENLIGPMRTTLNNLNSNFVEMNGILRDLYAQTPQLASIISKSSSLLTDVQKTIEALNNNPILRGGIPQDKPIEDIGNKLRETKVEP